MNKGNSADYTAGRITPEMAVGHSLQHIAQLYETHPPRASRSTGSSTRSKRRWIA